MKRTENMPLMVYWGLIGLKKRSEALFFLALSVGAALVCAMLSFFDLAALGLLAAVWYWYAIRWADKHAIWNAT